MGSNVSYQGDLKSSVVCSRRDIVVSVSEVGRNNLYRLKVSNFLEYGIFKSTKLAENLAS